MSVHQQSARQDATGKPEPSATGQNSVTGPASAKGPASADHQSTAEKTSVKHPIGETVRAAGILLMLRDDAGLHFLLMRHPKRWDLPKGHCDQGETFRETAARETHEETGIPETAIQWDPVFQFDIRYQTTYRSSGDAVFEKHVRYFLGFLTKWPDLELTEHESAQWFPWNPPHQIQAQTIDPLLAAVAEHLDRSNQV